MSVEIPKFKNPAIFTAVMKLMKKWYKVGEGGPLVEGSGGLESVYIDFNKFNHNRLFESSKKMSEGFRTFGRMMQSVANARKTNKNEFSSPADRKTEAADGFWGDVGKEAESLGIGLIGFTRTDHNFIFLKDHVGYVTKLYPNAVVLGMEMDFKRIDAAPDMTAGLEAMKIYADLGIATNKLAQFIRSKGHGAVACHPLGGPILYPAMAEKAGIGEMGRNGLIITKKYGPRQRLSMIGVTANPAPQQEIENIGIDDFCNKCGICIKKCPGDAIHEVPVKGKCGTLSRVDSEKCFPFFYDTHGCSVCIQVCPLHKKPYESLIGPK